MVKRGKRRLDECKGGGCRVSGYKFNICCSQEDWWMNGRSERDRDGGNIISSGYHAVLLALVSCCWTAVFLLFAFPPFLSAKKTFLFLFFHFIILLLSLPLLTPPKKRFITLALTSLSSLFFCSFCPLCTRLLGLCLFPLISCLSSVLWPPSGPLLSRYMNCYWYLHIINRLLPNATPHFPFHTNTISMWLLR